MRFAVLILGVMFISTILLWGMGGVSFSYHGPKLTCSEKAFDFGSRSNLSLVKHSFVLSNKGKAPLEIYRMETTCGCAKALLSTKKPIDPGSSCTLDVSLTLQDRLGPVKESIFLETNDPQKPQILLNINGKVYKSMRFIPEMAVFHRISADSIEEALVDVVMTDPNLSFKIIDIKSTSPYLKATGHWAESKRTFRVIIKTKPPLPYGYFSGAILLKTNDATVPDIKIRVAGKVTGEIDVVPGEIIIPYQDKGHVITRFISLFPNQVHDLRLMNIKPPLRSIDTQVFETSDGGFIIRLQNLRADKVRGKALKITTNVETMKEIVIPFHLIGSSAGGN